MQEEAPRKHVAAALAVGALGRATQPRSGSVGALWAAFVIDKGVRAARKVARAGWPEKDNLCEDAAREAVRPRVGATNGAGARLEWSKMRAPLWRVFAASSLALILGSAPAAAASGPLVVVAGPAGDSQEKARTHFARGVELFEDGDFASAVFEFETAHELSGNAHLLYNIAVCRDELHEYAAAMSAYQRYLDTLGAGLDADRLEKVRLELDRLQLRVGTLRVESTPPGATVFVGGEKLGETPLELPLDLGQAELELRLDGYDAEQRTLRIVSGETTEISVVLSDANAAGAPLPPPATAAGDFRPTEGGSSGDDLDQRRRVKALRTGAIVSLSIAGATGVAAAVFGGLAVSANNDLEDERGTETTRGELDDLSQTRDNRALTTDVLLAVTGVAAITSLALGIAHLRKKKRLAKESAAVEVAPGGLRVRF